MSSIRTKPPEKDLIVKLKKLLDEYTATPDQLQIARAELNRLARCGESGAIFRHTVLSRRIAECETHLLTKKLLLRLVPSSVLDEEPASELAVDLMLMSIAKKALSDSLPR